MLKYLFLFMTSSLFGMGFSVRDLQKMPVAYEAADNQVNNSVKNTGKHRRTRSVTNIDAEVDAIVERQLSLAVQNAEINTLTALSISRESSTSCSPLFSQEGSPTDSPCVTPCLKNGAKWEQEMYVAYFNKEDAPNTILADSWLYPLVEITAKTRDLRVERGEYNDDGCSSQKKALFSKKITKDEFDEQVERCIAEGNEEDLEDFLKIFDENSQHYKRLKTALEMKSIQFAFMFKAAMDTRDVKAFQRLKSCYNVGSPKYAKIEQALHQLEQSRS